LEAEWSRKFEDLEEQSTREISSLNNERNGLKARLEDSRKEVQQWQQRYSGLISENDRQGLIEFTKNILIFS
jgi:hypothetical protein